MESGATFTMEGVLVFFGGERLDLRGPAGACGVCLMFAGRTAVMYVPTVVDDSMT